MKNKEQIEFKNWKTISLREFDEMQEVIENSTDETEATVALLSLLSGKDEDYFWNKPLTDFGQYTKHLEFLKDYNIKPTQPRNIKSVKIGKNKYRLTNFADMTTAQFFDFQSIIKGMGKSKFDIAQILSIFLVPEGSIYNDGYSVSELREYIYDNFTFDEAQNLMSFLIAKFLRLLTPSKGYLAEMMKKTTKEQREEMVKNLDEMIALLMDTSNSIS